MKTLLISELKSFSKNWRFLLLLLIIFLFGTFGGSNARFTISENLAYNSPYQIAFITAFLSLTSLFFATIFTAQLALKEIDYNFNLIYFSFPITPKQFIWSRFLFLFTLTLCSTFLLSIGFFVGREIKMNDNLSASFSVFNYLLPILFFTVINSFFVVAVTSTVAWFSKNKLYVYVSGLLLYVLYMVALLFSGSPFMANQLPQSKQAQWISALSDPFGISAFFYQTSNLSIVERNANLLELSETVLVNRIAIILLAVLLLFFVSKKFSISKKFKITKSNFLENKKSISIPFHFIDTLNDKKVKWQSFLSFTKINSLYVIKSIPFVLLTIGLLFAVGMEMYAEIEKGIRLPQKYATSGLMVSAIIQNFYVLGALIIAFYGTDLFWRSKSSNFHLIEESTSNYKLKFWSIGFVLIGTAFFFTSVLIIEGICFQVLYDYPTIELGVYAKSYLFTTLPLILVAGLTLFIQKIIRNKYLSLGISGVVVLLMTTSLGKAIIKYPLLKFLFSISFDYSDMNGFGVYEKAFTIRLFFGFIVISLLLFFIHQRKKSVRSGLFLITTLIVICLAIFVGNKVVSDYNPKSNEAVEIQFANYEKEFRKFQNLPQPTIIKVNSKVDLYPSESRYTINGSYVLENKTNESISEILFNFSDNFTISKAELHHKNQNISVSKQFQIIKLKEALSPNQKTTFNFEISYQWKPVNGHQSFNSIVENGSFMRISRYFPQIGYQTDYEIEDEKTRKNYGLGKVTVIKRFDAPKVPNNDFIDLDMTVSTEPNQIVIGVGELQKQFKENGRNVFQYRTEAIPFRFAISSAKYAIKKEVYKGKLFEVFYHPSHFENVKHLIKNAKITMDYCETNFGKYPFKTIRFAEISSFTQGFNATAYPATIYMTEQMSFHCDITADKQQDVINELAGHELAHLWWGNNQINPDEREGDVMLTETLAMYTELMLQKKIYGKQKAEESVKMHQEIYESEKGFSGDTPLIKVTGDLTHISYSKGAVVMYKLSELIGEEKVNLALRNFLTKHKYPASKPISTDFLEEVYKVSNVEDYIEIKTLFLNM